MSDAPAAPKLSDFQARDAANPFGSSMPVAQPVGALANAESQRSVAEVQARMIIARANPRDPRRAMDLILQDCTRPSLAKDALYQYSRGGSAISGPSIRLAEAIAQRWGNIASGIKEVTRANGYSECVAYAWDLETGYYDERQFQIRHWRDTKSGGYQITDERDIYELVANLGQRRKRAVLLTVIPGDVVEAATDQCEKTLNASADTSAPALKRLVDAFANFGVTQEQIEKRCQCRLQAIRPAQIVQLGKIYVSLRDEMSSPADWFEGGGIADFVARRNASVAATVPFKAPEPDTKPAETKPTPKPRVAKAPAKAQPAEDHDPRDDEVPPPGDDKVVPAASVPSGMSRPDDPTGPFEAYLSDETGEIVAGPFADPLPWAGAFHKLFVAADAADRAAIWDANFEIIEALREHPTVGPMLESLSAEEQEAEGDQTEQSEPFPEALPLTESRGKPDWKTYLTAAGGFYHTLVLQSAETIDGWLTAQMPTLMRAGGPQQLAVRGRITKHCQELGVDVPACVAPLGVPQEAKPVAAEPMMESVIVQLDGTEWPIAWTKDVGHVESRLAEMRGLPGRNEMQRYLASTPQTLLLERLEREDKGRLATHFRVQAKAIMDAP